MFQAKWYLLVFAGFLLCSCIAPVLQKTYHPGYPWYRPSY